MVLIVWDGMRPDFVSKEHTPVLWNLASEGVVFSRHHAVYPSATEVNGVALATGLYPGRSGMIANHEYRPGIDAKKSIDTEVPNVVGRGDTLSNGKYIAGPTIAELVRKSGRHSVVAGAKGVALLYDRHLDPERAQNGVALFAGDTLPRSVLPPIVARLGPFPRAEQKLSVQRDDWTAKALIEVLWENGVPDFSLLWLAEPDYSEHKFAPGSKEALTAIESADGNLGRVLAALDRQGARQTTDVFVVSDHGFSTIEHSVDLRKILKDAGFDAVTEFASEPKAGQIMLVGNGGSVLFYVTRHDAGTIHRLVEFLQQSDFAGVIFTKQPMEGTFSFEQARIDPPSVAAATYDAAGSDHAPDVEMAFRWRDSKNQFGVPGLIDADWNRAAGQGTHATLSHFDMHSTLIVAGPDFRRGETNELPTGNVDLAPTICRILGTTPPQKLDGRILSEAMVNIDVVSAKADKNTVEAVREFPSGAWRQSLQISRVGSVVYFDEGNGAFVARQGADRRKFVREPNELVISRELAR